MNLNARYVIVLCLILFSCDPDDEPANRAPVIENQSFEVAEDISDAVVIGTASATDADNDDLTFSITVNDNNLFEITDDGMLSLANGQNLDFETATSHTITVQVSDGEANDTATITINVTDVDENSMPDIGVQVFNVAEDIAGPIGTVTASDMDGDNLTFTITTNSGNLFQINNSGVLSLNAGQELDFETADSHALVVQVSDGSLTDMASITVNVADVNEAPEVNDQQFTTAEDIASTADIGSVAADDEDANTTLTYSITTNSGSLFQIDNAGVLRVANGQELDFETAQSHTLTVDVSDGTLTTTATITVNVTDANDAPDVDAQTFTVVEDVSDNTTIGTVVATDQDGDDISFSILVDADNLFEINSQGEISLITDKSLDFETSMSHTISVEVSDGELATEAQITISVTNVNELEIVASGLTAPRGISVDVSGNLFIADNNLIKRIDSNGNVSTIAGNAGSAGLSIDGQGTAASFSFADRITIDNSGNLFISDRMSVRRISSSGNVTTSFVGSPLNGIGGIAVDANSDFIYLSSTRDIIQRLSTDSSLPIADLLKTIAGRVNSEGFVNSTGANSFFENPMDVVVNGNSLFVAERGRIRRIDLSDTDYNVTTFAGNGGDSDTDGVGEAAGLNRPRAMTMGPNGALYVVCGPTNTAGRSSIRKIDMNGNVTTIVAQSFGVDNGLGIVNDIALDSAGNIYLTDSQGTRVIKIAQ